MTMTIKSSVLRAMAKFLHRGEGYYAIFVDGNLVYVYSGQALVMLRVPGMDISPARSLDPNAIPKGDVLVDLATAKETQQCDPVDRRTLEFFCGPCDPETKALFVSPGWLPMFMSVLGVRFATFKVGSMNGESAVFESGNARMVVSPTKTDGIPGRF